MTSSTNDLEIAIIGMAGRFPGAASPRELWTQLADGVESIVDFTDAELLASGVSPSLLENPGYVRRGAFIPNIEEFDADFFAINPREAETIDPQQRIFLECAWEALEDAGYVPDGVTVPVGVFAGSAMSSYLFNLADRDAMQTVGSVRFLSTLFGNAPENLTTRTAYKLNLKGPAVTIQTACSTAGVAIHSACQSLLNRECDMALAGGVSLRVPQKAGYLPEGGMLSPDGHCRAFDAKSQGTVFGNGAGVVVLKRLQDAIADRDHIYAVVKGSAVNNDGGAKVGYTAPSIDGQAAVIGEALAVSGVDPRTIGYVEAHGTGTPLGDPIEVAALTQAYRAYTDESGFCAIGSVKTNIGHLDAAAGVAGVIKTALSLSHAQIPPSLHYEAPNPKIDFARSPFVVNDCLSSWPANGDKRRAGVSSFGVGGTNVHLILEEAPAVARDEADARDWTLLLLSARTPEALDQATIRLGEHLDREVDAALGDTAYTLATGRKAFGRRRAVLCRGRAEAIATLRGGAPSRVVTSPGRTSERRAAFMFPGQGSQHPDMTRGLYETEPEFAAVVDACCAQLAPRLGLDLRSLLFPTPDRMEDSAARLAQTSVTQPALFVVEYALARLLQSWGIEPAAMIGHSIGEYVAACIAGVLPLEAALGLVEARGRLMQGLEPGAMLAVHADAARVSPFVGDAVALAAINAPELCVLSGSKSAIDRIARQLDEEGVTTTRLHTSHAFHSHMMEPILEEFVTLVARAPLSPPKIPFVSNLTGTWITDAQATDPCYWAQHLRQTVRFSDGVATLLADSSLELLEVGPGQALSTLAKQRAPEAAARTIPLARAYRSRESDAAVLLAGLGRAWTDGLRVDWARFFAREQPRRASLPTYPFERRRIWADPIERRASQAPAALLEPTGHPMLGRRVAASAPVVQFEADVDPAAPGILFMVDHNIRGIALVPGTAYVDLGLKVASIVFGDEHPCVHDVEFREAMYLLEGERRTVQVVALPGAGGDLEFRILSRVAGSGSEWTLHAQGRMRPADGASAPAPRESIDAIKARCAEVVSREEFYLQMGKWGSMFGPLFKGVHTIWRRDGEAIGEVKLPEPLRADMASFVGQPSFLDSCVNVTSTTLPTWTEGSLDKPFYLPSGCRQVRIHKRPGPEALVHTILRRGTDTDSEALEGDILVLDADGELVLEMIGWHERRVGSLRATSAATLQRWLYDVKWERSDGAAPTADITGRWLVVAGDDETSEALISRMRASAAEVVVVRAHVHVREAIEAVLARGGDLAGVVHIASLGTAEATLEQAQESGVLSALSLIQVLAATDMTTHVSLVTRRTQPVGDALVDPTHAPLWAFGKVVPLEHPSLACTRIDLDAASSPAEIEALFQAIARPDPEDQIALRGAQRHVPRLTSFVRSSPAPREPLALDPNATYLVTGGLGGIGLRVAEWLGTRGARSIALLGRSAPSPEAHDALAKLAAAGVDARVFAADVSRRDELAATLGLIDREMPPLRGVLHAAGALDDGLIPSMTPERFAHVAASKVTGARNLHDLTLQARLDFFVLFSSIASVVGSPGQSSYVAANGYLDALAHERRLAGLPALSINWGSWSEVGMAARHFKDGELAKRGLGTMSPEEGLALLEQLVASDATQVVVLPAPPGAALKQNPLLATLPIFAELAKVSLQAEGEPVLHPRPAVSSEFVAPRTELELVIARVWQSVLGIDRVGVHDSFFDLGGHSLLAPQVLVGLRKAFSVDLPLKLVFEATDIAQAAERVKGVIEARAAKADEAEAAKLRRLLAPAE